MNNFTWVIVVALALLARPLAAQHRPPSYDYHLTEPDQELNDFSGRFIGIHRIQPQLRGVRGLDSTLYWVSADGKRLTAYRRGRQLWQANVAQAFSQLLPGAKIERVILSSGVVFVFTGRGGHAEVDRATGRVTAVGVDAD